MTKLSVSGREQDLFKRIEELVASGERITLELDGREIGVVMSPGDLELLEQLEDMYDIEEAERRLNDPNEVPIPYEEARKRLGLDE